MLGILKSSPSRLHCLMAERWTFVHELRITCKQWLNQSIGSRGGLRSREEKTISWWIQGDWWLKLPGWAGCRECVWVWWRLCPHEQALFTLWQPEHKECSPEMSLSLYFHISHSLDMELSAGWFIVEKGFCFPRWLENLEATTKI